MTISVRSRIFVTTPDGRSHTGVVTGLRGQGMADLLLDDGRAIRQPVSALRPALARTNGRHARYNPRARRNTGDVYDQAAAVLVDPSRAETIKDRSMGGLTVGDEKVDKLVSGIKGQLAARGSRLGRAAAWAQGHPATVEEIAEALRAYGPRLPSQFDSYLSGLRGLPRGAYTPRDPDAERDLLLLYALHDTVFRGPPASAVKPGAAVTPDAAYIDVARLLLSGKNKLPSFTDGQLEALTGERVQPAAYVQLIRERLLQDFAGEGSAVYKIPRPALDALLTSSEEAAKGAAQEKLRAATDKFSRAEAVEDRVAADKERKEAADKLKKLLASYEKVERERRDARFDQAKRELARVDGQADTVEALAADLQAAFGTLPAEVERNLHSSEGLLRDAAVSTEDTRKLFLLRELRSLMTPQATKEKATAASAAERARREKAELRAESVHVGRREDRTAKDRQSRELAKQIGGVDLKTFTDKEKIAYSIIPDPLRETRDKSYLCGNALDGYAYTVATTTQTRTVRHWLTWRDLGITKQGAAAPLFTALVAARRGEKATASLLTVKRLAALVAENQPLALAYDRVPVTVNTIPKGQRSNILILTRTPVSRFLTGGGVYNEFEVNVVSDVPDAVVADMRKESGESQPQFDVVDIQPALQRVRAGSQTGSLYPRRPMPPKSPTPGEFNEDAPVLLTLHSGYHGAPDVFGFSVVREVETATALFDDFKPYPGYSYKDRNPYFSWQPEAAGQFSAMVTGTGERPCANPDMVAQLNALRKAHYTILAVVRAATRVNEVLTREDGVNTLSDERGVNAVVRAMEGVVKALVRITRLQQSIADERLIQGARLSSTSDFSVFANPEGFIAAVTPAEPNGEDIAKLSRLAADITTTKDLVEQLSREAANFQLVQQVRVPTKNDPDRIDVVPADIERLLSAMASNTSALVNVKRAGPVSVYSVAPAYKNEPRAPFVVVAGALCESAPLADVVASLVPDIAQLALLDVPATTLGEALENQPLASAEAMLRTARRGTHRPSPSERANLKLWWVRVRSLLADMYAPHAFRGQKVLSAKFVGLVDFLIARELSALEGGAPWDEWDGVTSPIAAISLSIFASTFLGDPKVGGLLAHAPLAPAARINAGRGSTETDDMVRRAAQSGYSVEKRLTPEEEAFNKEVRLRQQNMTRTDTQPISYQLGKASQEKAEEKMRARVAEQSAAKVSGATIESIAQSLQASMEYAQRSLVGGGQVSETEKGVKLHYTYNPLLFQLLRLYYHQDRGPKEQEPVPVAAAPTANPNPSPKRTRDIYTEAAEALALAADRSPTEISFFASSIPVLPPPPMRTTEQLATQIAERMKRHPKSYQKSLSRLARKQIPLVTVANELQKALPRVQDILNFYRSRIEGLAQEGKITSDASADQKALLLFAVYEALAQPPETPARAPYTKASFSVEASASRAPLDVRLPLRRPAPAPPPESPLLKARQGDVFTAPEQAQNLFRGFSQETEGADRKTTHKTINKKMLRLIDWVGVYGSLLDLVRRSVLAYKRDQGSAPLEWSDVHDGWLLFMGPKVKNSNSTLSDIPQQWLDLCPMDEDGKSWAARYRAMTEDETGDTIKSTVLWAKGYAARGLSYAGELARRGFGEAKFAHEAFAVPLRADEDVFLRRDGTAVENDTLSALRKLLRRNAEALHALEKDAKRVDPRQNWSNIEDGASTTQLIALSVSPLAHARLLTEDQLRALVEALILPQTAPDSPLAFHATVSLPYTLFRAYVNALMQLRVQTENLEPPTYPTAPKGKAVSLIRPTAAAMVAEPANSFLGISQDRENMRRLLLRLVTEKQVALAVDYKKPPRGSSSSSP